MDAVMGKVRAVCLMCVLRERRLVVDLLLLLKVSRLPQLLCLVVVLSNIVPLVG